MTLSRTLFLGLWMTTANSALAQASGPAPAGSTAPQLTRTPELLTFVQAPFPPEEAGHTGEVILALTLDAQGLVTAVEVATSASPAFDAAAIEAARGFVFSPAEIDGQPSAIRILYRYAFVETLVLPETAIFVGVVRNRETKEPLPGVRVALADGRTVETDTEGRFRFDEVGVGTQGVTLQGPQLAAVSTEETFTAGEQLDATYDVFLLDPEEEADDLEIVVLAPALRKSAVSTEISAEDARRVPGTQGDVLKVVENMPGVARASLGTGAIIVWGAAPEDTGVYVDGIRIPRLYHDGGLRSVVGSEIVKGVELVPGGYGAAWGRGLGGLVTVTTKPVGERAGVHGAAQADVYDGGAYVEGATAKGLGFGVGGRASWVAPLLREFYPDVEDTFPVPRSWDATARVGGRLGANRHLDLTAIASSDQTTRTAPNPDPARETAETRRLAFQRAWLRYTAEPGDGSSTRVLIGGGADQADQVSTFGPVETSVRSDTATANVRASHRRRVGERWVIEVGFDGAMDRHHIVRRGSIGMPTREGDVRAFGQPPPDQIGTDDFTVTQIGVAPYAEAEATLVPDRLVATFGLRFDPYIRSISRAFPAAGISPTHGLLLSNFAAEPRGTLRWTPAEGAFVTASAGLYHQPPTAADLSATFGNPTLPTARGWHAVLAAGARPVAPLSVEATAFYTETRDLAMRNPAAEPARAEALLPIGSGRTYGAQVMLRLDPVKGVYGWASYTLAWAQRRSTPDAAWRPSDYDQRHVLTTVAGIRLPLDFDVGLRARVSTGYPRTEVVGAYYDSRRDLYQPLFGDQNQLRLPTFFQLDVRVAKAFKVATSTAEVYLDVQNVTNQRNVEEYVYSGDFQQRGALRGLPILPVLGLRWSF